MHFATQPSRQAGKVYFGSFRAGRLPLEALPAPPAAGREQDRAALPSDKRQSHPWFLSELLGQESQCPASPHTKFISSEQPFPSNTALEKHGTARAASP